MFGSLFKIITSVFDKNVLSFNSIRSAFKRSITYVFLTRSTLNDFLLFDRVKVLVTMNLIRYDITL